MSPPPNKILDTALFKTREISAILNNDQLCAKKPFKSDATLKVMGTDVLSGGNYEIAKSSFFIYPCFRPYCYNHFQNKLVTSSCNYSELAFSYWTLLFYFYAVILSLATSNHCQSIRWSAVSNFYFFEESVFRWIFYFT